MRRLVILSLVAAALVFAQAPSDTLTIHRKPPIKGSIMFPVTSPTSDMPVGVWRHINKKATAGTIVWFHGGMTSNNCQKGLIAGGSLSKMLPDYTIVSASACKQNHWVEPTTIEALDDALDSLVKRQKKEITEISLVGISDGSLGVIAYSIWGKRKIKNRILISSYGEALGPAAQVAAQAPLKNGRWRFIQGGSDRLYPADKTVPWIQEFCKTVGTGCDLKFDPQGEHDWSYWENNRKDWILEIFSK
jgi:hypothetical protein